MLRISATAQTCSKTVGGASCPAFNIFAVNCTLFLYEPQEYDHKKAGR